MELKDIYDLFDRFESSSCRKMELDMNGAHLCLEKGEYNGGTVATSVPVHPASMEAAAKEIQNVAAPAATVTEASEDTIAVRAPLVGTFYRAAGPDEEPFVKEGQKIHKGDVVGIIEAMKLMNEVTAPQDGIVDSIAAEDGKMVEYNQILITLK